MLLSALAVATANRPPFALDFTSGALPAGVTYTGNDGKGTRIDSTGTMVASVADTPRFDYDPTTLASRGILVEPARTNLLLHSSDLSQAAWTNVSTPTLSSNSTVAPDGTTTADTLGDDNASAIEGKSQSAAASASTTYVGSIFVKKTAGATNTFGLTASGQGGTGINRLGRLNTNSGTGNVNVTGVLDAGGFWRPYVAVTLNSGNNAAAAVIYGATGTNSDPNPGTDAVGATGTHIVWGAQIEAGASASTYIPTGASAVTRTADALSFTIPGGVTSLRYTFDDDSTQDVSVTPGNYTVPTNLNGSRVKRIVAL